MKTMQRAGLDTGSEFSTTVVPLARHQFVTTPPGARPCPQTCPVHVAAALLILLTSTSSVYAQEASPALKVTVGAFAVSSAIDTNLTTYLLAKSGDQYREANPILRGIAHKPATLALVKSGVAVGVSYTLLKLGRSDRQRTRVAALLTGIGLTAATSYVSYRNYQHYRKVRP